FLRTSFHRKRCGQNIAYESGEIPQMLREKRSKGHKINRTSGLFYSNTVEKPEAIRTALPKFQVFQSDERLP
ncbi:MAG: hypothetical protein IJS21_01825, partial [Deltaproteobacteria bacterium]|nr:hypothetical protein [Deltaproteobacteria bacterium]